MGSRENVLALIDGAWTTQAIAAACELGLFDALGTQARDAAALAQTLATDEDAVERLAKALCTLGLCERMPDGRFCLTRDGECLRVDSAGSLHGWARMAGTRLWSNWASLNECVRTGRSMRELRGHVDFHELDRDPVIARLFNAAMVDLTRPIAEAAAIMLDWNGVRTIVDVGGGTGALAAGVLARHSSLHGIVCDLAHAQDSAQAFLEAHGIAARCRFECHDFFASLPSGADAYMLKSVLHNWSDARATGILQTCRAVMTPRARLVVIERLEPAKASTDRYSREVARSDLNMLVGCGGRERTEEGFRRLLRGAGFAAQARVTPLVNGFYAITV